MFNAKAGEDDGPENVVQPAVKQKNKKLKSSEGAASEPAASGKEPGNHQRKEKPKKHRKDDVHPALSPAGNAGAGTPKDSSANTAVPAAVHASAAEPTSQPKKKKKRHRIEDNSHQPDVAAASMPGCGVADVLTGSSGVVLQQQQTASAPADGDLNTPKKKRKKQKDANLHLPPGMAAAATVKSEPGEEKLQSEANKPDGAATWKAKQGSKHAQPVHSPPQSNGMAMSKLTKKQKAEHSAHGLKPKVKAGKNRIKQKPE